MSATPDPRPGLSACIIAFQEEDRIEACLASLDFCDEVVVVDSHSTDRTRERAAAAGARVIERDWPGHVKQKEFAVRAAAHEWVLCVDADERIGPELRAEILSRRSAGFPGAPGYSMPRLSSYLGRPMRHGAWYPDRQLRLFDRRRGRWGGHDPHDRVELEGQPARLAGDLWHDPYRSFAEHMATIERYTTTMAQGLHERGKRAGVLRLVANPAVAFLRQYFLQLGLLDGWRGLLMAYLGAHYTRLKYAKLMVLERIGSLDGPPAPAALAGEPPRVDSQAP